MTNATSVDALATLRKIRLE